MAEINPWNTPSIEEEADDLFTEEGDDEEAKGRKKEAQDQMKEAGMLLVSGSEWKEKLIETLNEACEDEETAKTLASADTIFKSVEKASKATCLVVRRKNSESGRQCGTGTGFLMSPKHLEFGWLVITNNHVIMDEEEAKSAEVIFDHLGDDSKENTKLFKVKQLVSKDIRTKSAEDFTSLDFSVLALESGGTDEDYLKNRAMPFEETILVNSCANGSILKMCGLQFTPIIAFSHPHGLGKRFSIGKFPDKCEEYPTTHIRHDLPTARGSSGANLIVAPPAKDLFVDWRAAFVHYRHGHAVAWQAIGPVIRKTFSSPK